MALTIEQAVAGIQANHGGGPYNAYYSHTDENGFFVIQVREFVVDDPATGDGHTVTYDWFPVNPETGAYTSMFLEITGVVPVPNKKLVIDPGHGGTDPGAIGDAIEEAAAILITSNRVKQYLEEHYIVDVLMTRNDNQTYPTLAERAQFAIDVNADAFVSIHYNKYNGTAYGYEEFIQNTATHPATADSLSFQDVLHAKIVPVLQAYGIRDRGQKSGDFQVLRDSHGHCPGLLIEGLFLDNITDAEFFYRADWQRDFTKAVAEGIAEFMQLPTLNPATADFQVYSESGALIGQYGTIDETTAAVKNFYNAGNIDELKVKMIKPRPIAKTPFQRVFDFKGKVKGDGDANRTIWYTGSHTVDVAPELIASEVGGGYAGIGTKGDGTYLSYSITGAPVGRQVQFELDFGMFQIGDRQFLADNVDLVTFTVTPKAGCKYYIKVYNPTNNSYKTLHADTVGTLGEKSVSIAKAELMQYISPNGFIRFDLISAQKTTETSGVAIDFDYAKLTVDYSI